MPEQFRIRLVVILLVATFLVLPACLMLVRRGARPRARADSPTQIHEQFRLRLVVILLVATFLVLPACLMLVRRGARTRLKRFLFVSAAGLLALTCSALVILLLLRFGVLELEWRGGYVPVLTQKKTKADFDALDRNRAAQGQSETAPLMAGRAG